ncbi:hypothetical protein SBOR_5318 [Sclerotinia borealis F-4128]|uniref:Uncharacterized protein n=1 Tax=Sclerotinia borealis (strain F-4128) TaxID=1432307 RepID=W9CC58_SCLBF|nr:hypothetical protein SBOR_5318 [Sclerotinia borealis F-4128]
MSFPTDFTQSIKRNKKQKRRTYNSANDYILPSIDTSTLDFEIFEDARCAVCDGDLDPRQPEALPQILPDLCRACQKQVAQLQLEQEHIAKEKRKRQMRGIQAAIDAQLAQSELCKVLVDGNEKLRGEIEEIERQILVQEERNEVLRRFREEELRGSEG